MSLVTVYLVELCFADVGLLPIALWLNLFAYEPPEPFEFIFCGELEARWGVVVEIVKVDGFEIATGLLLEILIWWYPWFCSIGWFMPLGWVGCPGETLKLPPTRCCFSPIPFVAFVLLLWLARNDPWNLPRVLLTFCDYIATFESIGLRPLFECPAVKWSYCVLLCMLF